MSQNRMAEHVKKSGWEQRRGTSDVTRPTSGSTLLVRLSSPFSQSGNGSGLGRRHSASTSLAISFADAEDECGSPFPAAIVQYIFLGRGSGVGRERERGGTYVCYITPFQGDERALMNFPSV